MKLSLTKLEAGSLAREDEDDDDSSSFETIESIEEVSYYEEFTRDEESSYETVEEEEVESEYEIEEKEIYISDYVTDSDNEDDANMSPQKTGSKKKGVKTSSLPKKGIGNNTPKTEPVSKEPPPGVTKRNRGKNRFRSDDSIKSNVTKKPGQGQKQKLTKKEKDDDLDSGSDEDEENPKDESDSDTPSKPSTSKKKMPIYAQSDPRSDPNYDPYKKTERMKWNPKDYYHNFSRDHTTVAKDMNRKWKFKDAERLRQRKLERKRQMEKGRKYKRVMKKVTVQRKIKKEKPEPRKVRRKKVKPPQVIRVRHTRQVVNKRRVKKDKAKHSEPILLIEMPKEERRMPLPLLGSSSPMTARTERPETHHTRSATPVCLTGKSNKAVSVDAAIPTKKLPESPRKNLKQFHATTKRTKSPITASKKEARSTKLTSPKDDRKELDAIVKKKCYMWYARLGQPNKKQFKAKVKKMLEKDGSKIDIDLKDIDALPWVGGGMLLSVREMNKLFVDPEDASDSD